MGFLWSRFGNPFAFIETEGAKGWDQPIGFHTWLKVNLYHAIADTPMTWWIRLLPQALLCLAFLATIPAINRRFGWGYAAFVLAAVAIPTLSTADFMGTGRYLLLAFPVFAWFGSLIAERHNVRATILIVNCALLLLATSLFASGYLLA